MNERGAPTPVAWTRLRAPESLMGPADPAAMKAAVAASPARAKYAEAIDRDSARERLAAKLDAGAKQAEREERPADEHVDYPGRSKPRARKRASRPQPTGGLQDALGSPLAKQLMRTATREIVRGVFGVGRRRR